MATATDQYIYDAIEAVLTRLKVKITLKSEQRSALKAFIQKRDVFCVLPTGFGKSLIYQLVPLVLEEMGLTERLLVIISPLLVLMEDQIKEAAKLHLTAMQLGVHDDGDILNGQCSLVFGTPKAWILNDKWRNMLSSEIYREKLFGIVVDEVHMTYKWGEGKDGHPAFRESFGRLEELRSLTKEGTPVLALTASADLESRRHVTEKLNMKRVTEVTVSPNRSNIRLGICHVPATTNLKCLHWVVKEVLDKGLSMSPIIIYCRTLKAIGKVYGYLRKELGDNAWVDKDTQPDNLIIEIFHSNTLETNKKRVVSSFNGDGNCRVVVATTSLGMGLNFPNISHVVMFGAPEDVEDLVQQIGRAGRNGCNAHAVLYHTKQYVHVDKSVRELVTHKQGCIRKKLYGYFESNPTNIEPGHLCCTYCHSSCTCDSGECAVPRPIYETPKEVISSPTKCRQVEPSDRMLIRDLLEDFRSTLVKDTCLYTDKSACTGFSIELIEAVVEQCQYIFDIRYIMDNIPVFKLQHAEAILEIIDDVFDDIHVDQVSFQEECFSEPDLDFMGYFDNDDGDEVPEMLGDNSDSDA